jgi:hypothetical protein
MTRLDAECLLLEISGQTWYVPFDTLAWIPRVGESIRLAGAIRGTVTHVEYEFAPQPPPVRVERNCRTSDYMRDHDELWSKWPDAANDASTYQWPMGTTECFADTEASGCVL